MHIHTHTSIYVLYMYAHLNISIIYRKVFVAAMHKYKHTFRSLNGSELTTALCAIFRHQPTHVTHTRAYLPKQKQKPRAKVGDHCWRWCRSFAARHDAVVLVLASSLVERAFPALMLTANNNNTNNQQDMASQ